MECNGVKVDTVVESTDLVEGEILTGKVYLTTPGGETKYITREDAILSILEGVNVNTKARVVGQDAALDYTSRITEFDCGQNSAWQWFWGDIS